MSNPKKRGRPPIAQPRTKRFEVRLTDEEHRRISGRGAEWLRETALAAIKREEEYEDVIRRARKAFKPPIPPSP